MIENKKREASIGTYLLIWILMLVLTMAAATSGIVFAGSLLEKIPVFVALVKTYLITAYFMNLKYERGFLRIMIFFAIGIIIVLGLFLYTDVGYR